MNPVAIEGHLTLVLIQWMIIIAAAFIFGRLGKRFLHQPLAVGEIAAGIILGPSVFGAICNWFANQSDSPDIGDIPAKIFPQETQTSMQLLGKLGLIFLLFQVGMEFDYSHLRAKSKTVTSVSIFGMVMPFLCGLVVAFIRSAAENFQCSACPAPFEAANCRSTQAASRSSRAVGAVMTGPTCSAHPAARPGSAGGGCSGRDGAPASRHTAGTPA